jgi:hypothetical protein
MNQRAWFVGLGLGPGFHANSTERNKTRYNPIRDNTKLSVTYCNNVFYVAFRPLVR